MATSPTNPRQRKSLRWRDYDYSQCGGYFVTILAHGRQPIFGTLIDGVVVLSPIGKIVSNVWFGLSTRFAFVEIDEFIVMPDHIHGILFLTQESSISKFVLPEAAPQTTLGTIIGTYKSTVTRLIHVEYPEFKGSVWHRNYYDRVIRNQKELNNIRSYIEANPVRVELEERESAWY